MESTKQTELQNIGNEAKDVWYKYYEIISPYKEQLWSYCLKLTHSPWEAEDLFQDTILKTFSSLFGYSHRNQRLLTKSFLFRVATNHWLDQRKKKQPMLDDNLENTHSLTDGHQLEVNEALEYLVQALPPRQAVVFILMESFNFTAKEVGELISSSEGAVNALLHRARTNIKNFNESVKLGEKTPYQMKSSYALNKFLDAYNRKDFHYIADMLLDDASFSFVQNMSTEYGKETIVKYSLNPEKGNKLSEKIEAYTETLWGREAIILLVEKENQKMLHDIQTIEWEDDKIARWKCYYFCEEFMLQAANVLNMNLSPRVFG